MPRAARRLTRDPPLRRVVSDIGAVAGRRHAIPAWFTVDVTDVLPRLQAQPHVSLTVLVAGTVARVVARHPRMHALRDVRGRVVTFEEVDVNVSVEVVVDGQPFPVNHVLRSSHERSLRDLDEELHRVKADPEGVSSRRLLRAAEVYLSLPAPVRRRLLGSVRRFPDRQKALMGTVGVTSVGMYGRGGAEWVCHSSCTPSTSSSVGWRRIPSSMPPAPWCPDSTCPSPSSSTTTSSTGRPSRDSSPTSGTTWRRAGRWTEGAGRQPCPVRLCSRGVSVLGGAPAGVGAAIASSSGAMLGPVTSRTIPVSAPNRSAWLRWPPTLNLPTIWVTAIETPTMWSSISETKSAGAEPTLHGRSAPSSMAFDSCVTARSSHRRSAWTSSSPHTWTTR